MADLVCRRCWETFTSDASKCSGCGVERPPQGWDRLGDTFGTQYRLVELLGKGSLTAVFAAELGTEGPRVAVKVPRVLKMPEAIDPGRWDRWFEEEAGTQSLCKDFPHVFVGVRRSFSSPFPHLIMELLPRPWTSLSSFTSGRSGPLAEVQVARLGRDLLKKIGEMHAQGYMHLDLKPGSIFITPADSKGVWGVRITDLRHMKHKNSPTTKEVPDQHDFTTVEYMSPEVMERKSPKFTSDLHSVGSILWQLATMEVPFPIQGKAGEDIRARSESMRKVPVQPPGMPDRFYQILARSLAPRVEDRFDSATEMSAALDEFAKVWLLRVETRVNDNKLVAEQLKSRLVGLQGFGRRAGDYLTTTGENVTANAKLEANRLEWGASLVEEHITKIESALKELTISTKRLVSNIADDIGVEPPEPMEDRKPRPIAPIIVTALVTLVVSIGLQATYHLIFPGTPESMSPAVGSAVEQPPQPLPEPASTTTTPEPASDHPVQPPAVQPPTNLLAPTKVEGAPVPAVAPGPHDKAGTAGSPPAAEGARASPEPTRIKKPPTRPRVKGEEGPRRGQIGKTCMSIGGKRVCR